MPESQLPGQALGRVEAHLENLVGQTRDLVQQVSRMASALEQQIRIIDEDRRDTASFRGRTREQLLELIEKNNATIGAVAKITPTVDGLKRDQQAKDISDAGTAGEERGAARMKSMGIAIAGAIGAGLMWLASEVLKFFHPVR